MIQIWQQYSVVSISRFYQLLSIKQQIKLVIITISLAAIQKATAFGYHIFSLIFIWPVVFTRNTLKSVARGIVSLIQFAKTTLKIGLLLGAFLTFLGFLFLLILMNTLLSISQDATGYVFDHLTSAVYSLLSKVLWISFIIMAVIVLRKC